MTAEGKRGGEDKAVRIGKGNAGVERRPDNEGHLDDAAS
jgi:hypothetical protein